MTPKKPFIILAIILFGILVAAIFALIASRPDLEGTWTTNEDSLWTQTEHTASLTFDDSRFTAVAYAGHFALDRISWVGIPIIANDVCGHCENRTFTQDDGMHVMRRTVTGTFEVTRRGLRSMSINFTCDHGVMSSRVINRITRDFMHFGDSTFTREQ